jgi:hypothetical protein
MGVLGTAVLALAAALIRLNRKHYKLFDSVAGIDRDLTTVEKEALPDLKDRMGKQNKILLDVQECCRQITRQTVKPAVPRTDPIGMASQEGTGRHSALRPIPSPYGPREDRN